MAWFNKQFGFTEGSYADTQSKFTLRGTVLTSSARPDRPFMAGSFETPSIEELQGRLDPFAATTLSGRLVVREVIGDVSAFHTERENAFALFQAASQFNCLEHPSSRGTPEDGIACYAQDYTQGPACATACCAGTVVRNYFAFDADEKKGQTAKEQVENLRDVEELIQNSKHKYFQVQSGYTLATDSSLKPLHDVLRDPKMAIKVVKKMKIGIQSDTEVTASAFGRKVYDGPKQIVTQCYCSAVSVSYSRASTTSWEPFARLVLEAAYLGTMHAAVENALRHPKEPGARRIYLTALGGGVFGNCEHWIEDAMRAAFKEFENYGFQIYLVSFRDSSSNFVRLAEEFPGK